MHLNRVLPVASMLLAVCVQGADKLPTHVPSANPKVVGNAAPNTLSPELFETAVAQGSVKLENPTGIFKYYGYNDEPNRPMVPIVSGSRLEARKTEPDKNTYLILHNQHGADPNYNYGTHFLFQGHENGVSGYITRINLDADGAHRVTLMATTLADGVSTFPVIDGSTWDPFAQRLLFTTEDSTVGGVWQATVDYPSSVVSLRGIIGIGGYEGIQNDDQGRLMILEDVGGSTGSNNSKRPNSYVYRFVPKDPSDLTRGGKLQVLQVQSKAYSGPIFFDPNQSIDAAVTSQDQLDLHTYGKLFDTTWVTIHDTDKDGTTPFMSIPLAKAAKGTPFKRPENGQFRPGSHFTEFIFDETGDTDITAGNVNGAYGAWGAIFRLKLTGTDTGKLSLVFNGDKVHAAFDNCAFWDADHIVFVEDAGDGLHADRNALDSAWLFDLNEDYSSPSAKPPVRVLAQGRDASATLDSVLTANANNSYSGVYNNDGDNEITGWHLSDGDPTALGLLGAKIPKPFQAGWRLFYTQQHGDNNTFEILSKDTIKDGN